MHTWVKFTEALDLYGWQGSGSLHLAEYCIELSKAYSLDADRPIWLQELGASSLWMAEEHISPFLEYSVRNAASCSKLWGIT
ncbi:hypothetical protein EHS13_09935 [Paenibacillus psychroresistens]|uniref:Uncharacterized protein n=1 Tax=Paenibacillus psychroresistens TaxID=1778678 RepID=A0A6B8RI06_9BACL|nr:hypothetical protein [Paenibacillus psychroresistens]QGQ95182.1 hypothetical protein EHS13_09935 [Paenibacillus psychroresistens]